MRIYDQLDPADIRFTQDSISLYFQHPYNNSSIKTAVRRISRNALSPDSFPAIRVIFYDGNYWSIDNRRLWVFRFARCQRVPVQIKRKMHYRLQDVISDPSSFALMKDPDFFPRVRDQGLRDWDFDIQFPKPLSAERLRNAGSTNASLHLPEPDSPVKLPSFQSAGSAGSTDCKRPPSAQQPPAGPFSSSADVEGQPGSSDLENLESGGLRWILRKSISCIEFLRKHASLAIKGMKAAMVNLIKATFVRIKAASLNLIKGAFTRIKAAFRIS